MREKLRKRRNDVGLTQTALAEAVNISRPFYTEIENGNKNCNLHTWIAISKVLSIPEAELLDYMKEA